MRVGSNRTVDSVSIAISIIDMTVRFAYFLYLRLIKKEKSGSISLTVRMAERSKEPDSRLRNLSPLELSVLVH